MAHARSEGPDFIKTDEKLPPSSELTPPNKHMPGLDVIRGLAIGGVIMYHGVVNSAQQFHSHISNLEYHSLNVFEIGYMGVPLFFVLSGFLITGILLDTRTNADYFKTFYVRRFLRIVPVYVLMIVLLKSLNEISWTFVLIALLYLSNMSHSAKIGKQYGAFWSLAVEEQFYLIWPLMIRKLSPRRSFYVATSLLFAIPVLRFVLLYLPHGFNDIYFKVWSVADFFAGGAVMAMAIRSSRLRSMLPAICVGTVALSAILFLLLYAASGAHSPVGVRILKATARSPWVFLFSGMVLFAYLKPSISKGALGQFLVFLGYISYGLYLCHPLIQTLIDRHWTLTTDTGTSLYSLILLRFTVEMGLAIGISYLSRRTFENFFLKLKPRQREVVQDLSLSSKINVSVT